MYIKFEMNRITFIKFMIKINLKQKIKEKYFNINIINFCYIIIVI